MQRLGGQGCVDEDLLVHSLSSTDLEDHPDTGGTSGQFQKLKQARDELLGDS